MKTTKKIAADIMNLTDGMQTFHPVVLSPGFRRSDLQATSTPPIEGKRNDA